jgi:hypothetical protein
MLFAEAVLRATPQRNGSDMRAIASTAASCTAISMLLLSASPSAAQQLSPVFANQ